MVAFVGPWEQLGLPPFYLCWPVSYATDKVTRLHAPTCSVFAETYNNYMLYAYKREENKQCQISQM